MIDRIRAVIVISALVLLGLLPATASAQGCFYMGRYDHTSLSGQWQGVDGEFYLNIYPCSNRSELFWTDTYGYNWKASYYANDAFVGGGWIGWVERGVRGPWQTNVIGYKPAEPGYIQVIFWLDQTDQLIIKRAQKVRGT